MGHGDKVSRGVKQKARAWKNIFAFQTTTFWQRLISLLTRRAHAVNDTAMSDTRRRKLDQMHHSECSVDAATVRTTRSDTRKVLADQTEGLLFDVLRTCGSLVNPDTYGLSLVDCARLAAVSKSSRTIVTTNECWSDALVAVEDAFKFVPVDDSDSEGYHDPPYFAWRKALGDPRYKTNLWESSSPMTKYNLLLPYAQEVIAIMKERSLDAGSDDWPLDLNELKGSVDEPVWDFSSITPEKQAENVSEMRSVIHLIEHNPFRYEILMKLVIANLFERGFKYDCYHVEDFFTGHVEDGGYEFGCDSSSWRQGNNELIFRLDCGDDYDLEALNTLMKMKINANTLGEKVYRSLMLLPLDLDAIARKVLAGDASTVAKLKKLEKNVEDYDDWRQIWKWKWHDDEPGSATDDDE